MNLEVACVLGASRGIGLAFVKKLVEKPEVKIVFAMARTVEQIDYSHPKLGEIYLDAANEESFFQAKEQMQKSADHIDLLINCIGFLHENEVLPERKIDEVNTENFVHSLKINVLPSIFMLKAFKDMLRESEAPVIASLSAKVGSIGDNRMGGWYSYRISKTALNMALKTAAIEFQRMKSSSRFFLLHPGTTKTKLSEPFLKFAKSKYKIHDPEDTAKNLLNLINRNLDQKEEPILFLSWDGERLSW